MNVISLILFCSFLPSPSFTSKILLIPTNHGSHVNFFSIIGQTMQNAGHEVHLLVTSNFSKTATNYDLKTIIPNVKAKRDVIEEQVIQKGNNILQVLSIELDECKSLVKHIFKDTATMNKLRDIEFDLIIIDGFEVARYLYVIPYKLTVPFISVTPRPDPWTSRVPSLPSFEGMMPLFILDQSSNIFHRILNTLANFVIMLCIPPSLFSPIDDKIISELVPEKPNIGFTDIYRKSELIIVNMDTICLDFPRVSSPFYKFIGGLGARPAKELPTELGNIMSASGEHGVIILTFGSGIKSLPQDMLHKFLAVFKDMKQTVLMRHVIPSKEEEERSKVPSNVHIMSWLPQNDLLGHRNTKLFITHGGNNGQLEAVYHAVPMLTLPMFGDQFYNAKRVEWHGYGKQLMSKTFSELQLKDTINELLENKSYYQNIYKCSRILHSLPSAQTEVRFWVEHILQFGGSHLKPFYLNMPLWKFFMIDVLLVFFLIFVFVFICLKWCCRKCFMYNQSYHAKKD